MDSLLKILANKVPKMPICGFFCCLFVKKKSMQSKDLGGFLKVLPNPQTQMELQI